MVEQPRDTARASGENVVARTHVARHRLGVPSELIAVVPAAGRGARLGIDTPKVFAQLRPGVRVWDVLLRRLATVTDHVHLVLSEEGVAFFDRLGRPSLDAVTVTVSCQPAPRGMGDAVLGAIEHWRAAHDIVILWGDQLGLRAETLARTVAAQREAPVPALTLPLVQTRAPYVHYDLDARGTLQRVLQAREGDSCPAHGLSDVGLFALSTAGLEPAWKRYVATAEARGAITGELNLLPFFAFLSREGAHSTRVVPVRDADEARGINTPEDLAWFRARS